MKAAHSPKDVYRASLAAGLGTTPDQITLFWKGRIGLYALLKAFGVQPGDEVIVPAFTCVVVPNAILYCGAVPVYVDINRHDYNMNPSLVEQLITPKTKCIIAQNTFGYSSDIDQLKALADRHQLLLLEDCTHGYGGFYKGKENGTLCDAAFFSTQWNKPFSTGIGGFAWVREKDVADRMQAFEAKLLEPGFIEVVVLRISLLVRRYLSNSSAYWTILKLYRLLSKIPGFPGSSSAGEIASTVEPQGYLKGLSQLQAKAGIPALQSVKSAVSHQCAVAAQYDAFFQQHGKPRQTYPELAGHTFLKYPILVKERARFLQEAEQHNIELGEWFLSPLHPVMDHLESWNYTVGSCPVAEDVSSKMINLPTHASMNEAQIQKVLTFLSERMDLIEVV